MAQVYREVNGLKLDAFIAHLPGSQGAVNEATVEVAQKARVLKAQHVDKGDSTVRYQIGEITGYVILDDNRGKKAAMSMEYGTGPNEGPFPDGTNPQAILHEAASLPLKSTFPRSKRKGKKLDKRRRRRRR